MEETASRSPSHPKRPRDPLVGAAIVALAALIAAWTAAVGNWHGAIVNSVVAGAILFELTVHRTGLLVMSTAQSSALFALTLAGLAFVLWFVAWWVSTLIFGTMALFLACRSAVAIRTDGWSGKQSKLVDGPER